MPYMIQRGRIFSLLPLNCRITPLMYCISWMNDKRTSTCYCLNLLRHSYLPQCIVLITILPEPWNHRRYKSHLHCGFVVQRFHANSVRVLYDLKGRSTQTSSGVPLLFMFNNVLMFGRQDSEWWILISWIVWLDSQISHKLEVSHKPFEIACHSLSL